MGYVVSQLMAVLGLEDRGFSAGMKNAQQETKKTKQEVESASSSFEKIGNSLGRIGSSLSLAVTVPLVALGRQAIKTATDFDSLKKGMIAVEGSAEKAEKSIKRLEQSARLPGLGFKEVQQGYINLRAAGQQADLAVRSLEAFGNALTTVGKGKSELDGVILALSQIESKGKVSAEEINQLAERVPQIRQIMIDAFGTADTEVIQRAKITSQQFVETIVGELEKLPKVAGGLRNEFDNAMDSIDKSLNRLGTSLAPKAASGLNFLADKVDRLSSAWEKLPKEQQDLITMLGLGALAVGPATVLLGNLAQLAVNLNSLGLSLGLVAKGGVVAVAVLAAIAAWKPNIDMGIETGKLNKQADAGNKYVSGSKLGQAIQNQSEAKLLADYLKAYKGSRVDRANFHQSHKDPQSQEILNRLLGPDRYKDTEFSISQARGKAAAAATAAQKGFDAGKIKSMGDTIKGIFDPLTIPNLIKNPYKLTAAEMAAKRKAEEDAKKEAERQRKKAEEERKRHQENIAKNNQELDRQIYLNGAKEDEFERRRRQAELDRRDNSKGGSAAKARLIYETEIARINREEKREAARPSAAALSNVPDSFARAGSSSILRAVKAMAAKQKQREALIAGSLRMPDIAGREGHGVGPSLWFGNVREDGTPMNAQEAREALRKAASEGVTSTMPNTIPTRVQHKYFNDTDYAKNVLWRRKAYLAGADTADSLGASSRLAGMELMRGASPQQAARTLSKSLVEALQQGAGREIERVVSRSLTDPIAKAIEQGFDPVTSKLKGAISESLNAVTGTAASLISSAYALYGIMGRKKKFGIGSLLGGVAGFVTGGPAGAMAGYNIGNALDNRDLAGAVTGYLATTLPQDAFGTPFKKPGNASVPDGADGRSVVIHASGWTVNSQADEKRLTENMARRVRLATVTGG
jgi:tape measure domain-containing protein